MADIVKLVDPWKREVADDVVTTLKRALAEAEAGNITAVALACVLRSNAIATSFSKTNRCHHMHSATQMLAHRYAETMVCGD